MLSTPDILLAQHDGGWEGMNAATGADWSWQDVSVRTELSGGELKVSLQAEKTALHRVALKWKRTIPTGARLMGDHWERGYGDLEWRGIVPERVLPWFFHLNAGKRTHSYGVKTGPNALCFWQVSDDSITLCLDVRCGGVGVLLHGRCLELATVVSRDGTEGESPFQAACAFMKLLCPAPALPKQPVYGGNNWYYAYGSSSHEEIIADSKFVASLAPTGSNRPFMVIDMGWERLRSTMESSMWRGGNGKFPDMGALAREMKAIGVRPGIWVRPLQAPDNAPDSLCLPVSRFKDANAYPGKYLDPSMPEVLSIVREDIAQQARWGYELVKHDFTTYDILGQWGFEMGGDVTKDGWSFADRSKTSAEVIRDLYRVIGEAAGGALIIGCNTIGHIGAGIFHMQRTGDDTSGRQWERTRKMGVNTLAFAMPKHGAFYASDADCAGITANVPWEMNRQWLELLAASGTPLFVSASPSVPEEQREAIRAAFAVASHEIPPAEPLDWMDTTCPAMWVLNDKTVRFHWNRQDAVEFLRP